WVAIGLLGKVLGPCGWALAVRSGELPPRTFTLILLNDIVWWLPFALFLLEGSRAGDLARRAAPWACAVANGLAAAAMALILLPGTAPGGGVEARLSYVEGHLAAWRAGWALWIPAALTLL